MITECPSNPADCIGDVVGGVVGSAASSAWDAVCRSFADAAMFLLKGFAEAFVAFPDTDVRSVTGTYAISMWIAGIITALLLLGQVIRTAVTHDGSALAYGLVGVGKALLAMLVTLTVAHTALVAADEISQGIIDRSLGGNDGLKKSLAGLFAVTSAGGTSLVPMSLILVLSLLGIFLTGGLWLEMLLRNAAVAVMVATAPVGAAGLVSEATRGWWIKGCAATVQLIAIKPVITLVFAIGFSISGNPAGASKPGELVSLLTGLLILLLAVVAWPVVARFFSFATVSVAGGGLAGILGFAAGRANTGSGPAGVAPGRLAQATEARTMSTSGANSATAAESGTAAATSGGGGAAAVSGAAAGAVAAPVALAAVAAAGIDMAQRAVNSVARGMEQTAGHAGIHGAHPHAKPAGHAQYHGSLGSSQAQPAAPIPYDRGATATGAAPDAGSPPPPTGSTDVASAADPGPPPPVFPASESPCTSPVEEAD